MVATYTHVIRARAFYDAFSFPYFNFAGETEATHWRPYTLLCFLNQIIQSGAALWTAIYCANLTSYLGEAI